MNTLVTLNGGEAVTMTSLELVEFINKQRKEGESELRHDHFMAKVPQVLGETVAPNFRGYYKAMNGKQNPMYRFPKREACLMAMSYSYDLQAKVFDRMTALEQKPTLNPANLSRLQLLEMAIQSEQERLAVVEQKAVVEAQLAIAAPKLEIYDLIVETDETLNMTEAAKVLQTPRDKLRNVLVMNKWLYKRAGSKNWLGFADKVQQGLIIHKLNPYIDQNTGEQHMSEQPRITGKGLVKLAQMLGVNLPPNGSTGMAASLSA